MKHEDECRRLFARVVDLERAAASLYRMAYALMVDARRVAGKRQDDGEGERG